MNVTCDGCGVGFRPELQERQMEGDMRDVGFECPGCGRWYHVAYTDAKARRLMNERDAAALKAKVLSSADRDRAVRKALALNQELQEHMRLLNRN